MARLPNLREREILIGLISESTYNRHTGMMKKEDVTKNSTAGSNLHRFFGYMLSPVRQAAVDDGSC